MALQLRKAGFKRVRPLAGGLDRWRALNFPTEPVSAAVPEGLTEKIKISDAV